MINNARLAWLLGVRSHAFRGLLFLGVLLLATAFLAGAFSLRQPLVVTLDVGITGIRALSALLVLFWMQEVFVRDIERRTITWALAQPIPRQSYVVGRFLGFAALCTVAIMLWGGGLWLLDQVADWGYSSSSRPHLGMGYLAVLGGIVVDALLIGAVVLAVASAAETKALPFFVGAAFVMAARSLGPVLDYLIYSAAADPELQQQFLPVLERIRWLIPELSRLDWRTIVLYGTWPPTTAIVQALMMAFGYIIVMTAFAVRMYSRREFV